MSSDATPIPAESTSTPASRDTFLNKVEKHLDTYRAKISKLQEENQKLRAQNSDLKSANSRVRRIPKKPVPAPVPEPAV